MTILASTICTKTGKVLVSRQFLEMPRSRIEGLMASFPKLLPAGTQHTTVDTDEVRFVYQPLEDLYLVLTTSKKSNILQDISTLHMFARVVSEHCKVLTEREVTDNAFDLINAFDELVSLGYRENLTLPQLRTIDQMESNEERIQEMIARNKEMEAKEQSRLKAKQLELQRKQMAKMGMGGLGHNAGMMHGSGMSAGNYTPIQQQPQTYSPSAASSPPRFAAEPALRGGMRLGGAKQQADFADVFGGAAQQVEQTFTAAAPTTAAQTAAARPVSNPAPAAPKEPVHITFDERITAVVNRDGGLQQLEVKGDMMVHATVNEASQARVTVELPPGGEAQFKTHPNIDKKAWSTNNTLQLKESCKSFPVGQASGVLKWRMVSKDEESVPLSINCWPNPTNDGYCDVNIEYDLLKTHMQLKNITLAIPIPLTGSGTQPAISHVDGDTVFDRQRGLLYWNIANINEENAAGSLDFKAHGDQPGGYFPVIVSFTSDTLYCPIKALTIVNPEGEDIEHGTTISCQAEDYRIV